MADGAMLKIAKYRYLVMMDAEWVTQAHLSSAILNF